MLNSPQGVAKCKEEPLSYVGIPHLTASPGSLGAAPRSPQEYEALLPEPWSPWLRQWGPKTRLSQGTPTDRDSARRRGKEGKKVISSYSLF